MTVCSYQNVVSPRTYGSINNEQIVTSTAAGSTPAPRELRAAPVAAGATVPWSVAVKEATVVLKPDKLETAA